MTNPCPDQRSPTHRVSVAVEESSSDASWLVLGQDLSQFAALDGRWAPAER